MQREHILIRGLLLFGIVVYELRVKECGLHEDWEWRMQRDKFAVSLQSVLSLRPILSLVNEDMRVPIDPQLQQRVASVLQFRKVPVIQQRAAIVYLCGQLQLEQDRLDKMRTATL